MYVQYKGNLQINVKIVLLKLNYNKCSVQGIKINSAHIIFLLRSLPLSTPDPNETTSLVRGISKLVVLLTVLITLLYSSIKAFSFLSLEVG